MRAVLLVLVVLIVLALVYLGLKVKDTVSRARARKVPDVFLLKPGAITREVSWTLPCGDSGTEVIGRVVSALQSQGARVLRQENSQAALYLGSRIEIKMHGKWPADPLKVPTRVLVRAETVAHTTTFRVRLDEDFGGQRILRLDKGEFQDSYNKTFDVLVKVLEKELGPHMPRGVSNC